MTPAGFPHSDIHGSQPAFGYPWLFVDRYVLLRLPVPRHPPCALLSLTCQQFSLLVFSIMLESLFFGFSLFTPTHLAVQCVSVIFCLFETDLSIVLGFTFFRFFFIQFSRYKLVGSSGLEPPTSRLSGVRSNHLSYEPMSVAVRGPAIPAYLCSDFSSLVEMNRIELSTPCLQGRCSPS